MNAALLRPETSSNASYMTNASKWAFIRHRAHYWYLECPTQLLSGNGTAQWSPFSVPLDRTKSGDSLIQICSDRRLFMTNTNFRTWNSTMAHLPSPVAFTALDPHRPSRLYSESFMYLRLVYFQVNAKITRPAQLVPDDYHQSQFWSELSKRSSSQQDAQSHSEHSDQFEEVSHWTENATQFSLSCKSQK